jgi:hypothetical protein
MFIQSQDHQMQGLLRWFYKASLTTFTPENTILISRKIIVLSWCKNEWLFPLPAYRFNTIYNDRSAGRYIENNKDFCLNQVG